MRPIFSVLLLAIVGPLVLFCQEARAQSGGGGRFATSLCDELIIPNEYNCKEYTAVTDDGFILGIYNIPSPRGFATAPSGGPPVLLMHGLEAGGDNWVLNGPQESLGFILADAGFDVWIGNNRAIQWSHGHVTFNPSQTQYWAWTYDELASYDLKAITEYVYNQRDGRKLLYIGHSLGTTNIMAGLTGGRFNTQILGYLNAAVLLAPIAISTHLTAPLLRVGLEIYSNQILTKIGDGELDTYLFANLTCTSPLINPSACNDVLTASLGQQYYIDQSRIQFYAQYTPQPTSSFNMNHLAQGLVRNNFAFYDKGPAGNMASYGQDTAPNYDLTTFPASLPTQYWVGSSDAVADPTDAATILAMLPSSNREVHYLADYGHLDFVVGYRSYVDIYPTIIKFLQNHV